MWCVIQVEAILHEAVFPFMVEPCGSFFIFYEAFYTARSA